MVHLEEPDLVFVERFFVDRRSLAVRIAKTTEKTPDFKILRGSTVVAFCEVKSPQDVFQERLNKAICAAPQGQGGRLVERGTVSRQYRCMERAATKAAAQFNAVNPLHAQPNILMFVNQDATSHQGDFEERSRQTRRTDWKAVWSAQRCSAALVPKPAISCQSSVFCGHLNEATKLGGSQTCSG